MLIYTKELSGTAVLHFALCKYYSIGSHQGFVLILSFILLLILSFIVFFLNFLKLYTGGYNRIPKFKENLVKGPEKYTSE